MFISSDTYIKAITELKEYENTIARLRELAKKFGDYDEFAEQFNTFTGTQIEDEILKALDGEQ